MKTVTLSRLLAAYERTEAEKRHVIHRRRNANGLFGIMADKDEHAIAYQRLDRKSTRIRRMMNDLIQAIEQTQPADGIEATICWHEGPDGAPTGKYLLVVCRLIMGYRLLMGYVNGGCWRMLVGNSNPYGRDELYVPAERIVYWAELPKYPNAGRLA